MWSGDASGSSPCRFTTMPCSSSSSSCAAVTAAAAPAMAARRARRAAWTRSVPVAHAGSAAAAADAVRKCPKRCGGSVMVRKGAVLGVSGGYRNDARLCHRSILCKESNGSRRMFQVPVIMAAPPWRTTASAMAAWSVATRTVRTFLACCALIFDQI